MSAGWNCARGRLSVDDDFCVSQLGIAIFALRLSIYDSRYIKKEKKRESESSSLLLVYISTNAIILPSKICIFILALSLLWNYKFCILYRISTGMCVYSVSL